MSNRDNFAQKLIFLGELPVPGNKSAPVITTTYLLAISLHISTVIIKTFLIGKRFLEIVFNRNCEKLYFLTTSS